MVGVCVCVRGDFKTTEEKGSGPSSTCRPAKKGKDLFCCEKRWRFGANGHYSCMGMCVCVIVRAMERGE